MKIGDKVIILDAYFPRHNGRGLTRENLIGRKGVIVLKTDHLPELYDWIVRFDGKIGNDDYWWFNSKDLRLLNPQLDFSFTE